MELNVEYFKELKLLHEHKLNPEYMAGLIDGDGSITVRRETQGRSSGYNGTVMLTIDLCEPSVILLLYTTFGGTYEEKAARKENDRKQHRWTMSGPRGVQMTERILPHLILKKKRAEHALKFWEMKCSGTATNADLDTIFNENSEMQQLDQLSFENDDIERITDKYVAGLFDAEGCVNVYQHSFALTITQKMRPEILHALADVYGMGKVYENIYWKIGTMEEFPLFSQRILEHVIVKQTQLEIATGLIPLPANERPSSLFDTIRNLKHTEYTLSVELKDTIQKIATVQNKENHIKRQICIPKEVRQGMSDKKKGENHPFWGTNRPPKVVLKISKNQVVNPNQELFREDILRELKAENPKTIQQLSKMYGVDRNVIGKMKSGIHVAPEERTISLKEMENQHRNDDFAVKLRDMGYDSGKIKTLLSKRKWSVPEYLMIRKRVHEEPNLGNKYKVLEKNSVEWFGKQFSYETLKGVVTGRNYLFDFETENLTEEERMYVGEIWTSEMMASKNLLKV
jgi:hypothetical protein